MSIHNPNNPDCAINRYRLLSFGVRLCTCPHCCPECQHETGHSLECSKYVVQENPCAHKPEPPNDHEHWRCVRDNMDCGMPDTNCDHQYPRVRCNKEICDGVEFIHSLHCGACNHAFPDTPREWTKEFYEVVVPRLRLKEENADGSFSEQAYMHNFIARVEQSAEERGELRGHASRHARAVVETDEAVTQREDEIYREAREKMVWDEEGDFQSDEYKMIYLSDLQIILKKRTI